MNQYVWPKSDYVKKYGKWACISGATDGIGLAMAHELAKRGHSIIVIGRSGEKLDKVKSALERQSNVAEVELVKNDLSDSSMENFIQLKSQIKADSRDIGILINCAGLSVEKGQRFSRFESDEIRAQANVNMLASVYLTKLVLPSMLTRGKGMVLNVSSTVGFFSSFPYGCLYGPTKAFLSNFTRGLQEEYATTGLHIVDLTPAMVATKLYTRAARIKVGFHICTPRDYAKSTLNAVASEKFKSLSGTFFHELVLVGIRVMDFFNFGALVLSQIFQSDQTID